MGRLVNEKGITLVELLAALALIGVIGALSFQLLTGMFTANSVTENDISLKQESNIILTSIREQAQGGDVEICINDEQSLLVNGEDVLRKDGLIITDFYAENRESGEKIAGKTFLQADNPSCFTSKVSQTLVVTMTITTNEGPSNYEISSTIPGLDAPDRNYTIETSGEENPGEENPPEEPSYEIFTTKEEFKALNPENINGWVEGHPDDNNEYTLSENTILNSSFPQNYSGDSVFQKSLWAQEDFMDLNNHHIEIAENMYIDRSSTWSNNNSVRAEGNALFQGDITMETQTSFSALNTYFQGNVEATNSEGIDTRGSIRIDGETHLKSQAKIITEGYFFADGNVRMDNNTNRIEAKRDVFLNNDVTMNGSVIKSEGTMQLNKSVTLNNQASLKSNEDIIIKGDALRDNGGKAKICAMGEITIIGSIDNNIETNPNLDNMASCN